MIEHEPGLISVAPLKPALQGALLTVVTLFGGLLVGLVLGDLVFNSLPGHSLDHPSPVHMAMAAIPALIGFRLGGAAWGLSMGRIAGAPGTRRMALAGLLGFAPITIALAIGLSVVETIASTAFLAQLPIQRLFTILFVPAAFLIAAISAWAIGRGQIYRYRHVSTSDERQHTRWVIFGFTIWIGYLLISTYPYFYLTSLPSGTSPPWWAPLSEFGWWVSLNIVPVTLAVSITRSRLWNIDIVINRTLV